MPGAKVSLGFLGFSTAEAAAKGRARSRCDLELTIQKNH